MLFILFTEDNIKDCTFTSVYELEKYVDSLRDLRGERYPKTERMSPFDYIKFIGWRMEIVPMRQVAQG